MNLIPCEYSIGGVYLPPLFVAGLVAFAATALTARLLNRCRLSRHFFYPPLVYLAVLVIYTVLAGTFLVPS